MTDEITPDYNDPGWRNVRLDTRTLDCMGGEHRDCPLPRDCQCDCHWGGAR